MHIGHQIIRSLVSELNPIKISAHNIIVRPMYSLIGVQHSCRAVEYPSVFAVDCRTDVMRL